MAREERLEVEFAGPEAPTDDLVRRLKVAAEAQSNCALRVRLRTLLESERAAEH